MAFAVLLLLDLHLGHIQFQTVVLAEEVGLLGVGELNIGPLLVRLVVGSFFFFTVCFRLGKALGRVLGGGGLCHHSFIV